MPLLYSAYDSKYFVYQPNFVRSRHRFRGPRESQKINLEINQILYDTHSLDKKQAALVSYTADARDSIMNGKSFSPVTFNWIDDSTPGAQPLVIPGFEELKKRVEALNTKIRFLGVN